MSHLDRKSDTRIQRELETLLEMYVESIVRAYRVIRIICSQFI